MAICLVIDDKVKVPVKGFLSDSKGRSSKFEFALICRRQSQEEIDVQVQTEGKKLSEIVQEVATDWEGVVGEDGKPVPFSQDALAQLLGIGNLSALAFTSYVKERGAKEKN